MRGEVLVAILNNLLDFAVARDEHWYRIPVSSARRFLKDRWPPDWLAFYQTKVFGDEAYAVNYYAQVLEVRKAYRWQLFPDEPRDEKSQRFYYQLILGPLKRLPKSIVSRRWRRIIFIPTTWQKFVSAVEINDLYDESPLEDRLWAELKRLKISAERQFFIEVNNRFYALDFALFCALGDLDVETDGDTWHSDPARIPEDNRRDNDLETAGWSLLRFNGAQIRERIEEYCLPTIVEKVNNLGGIDEGRLVPRLARLDGAGAMLQLGLFDEPEEE
jgi:very-short-patch-repair endonuclease